MFVPALKILRGQRVKFRSTAVQFSTGMSFVSPTIYKMRCSNPSLPFLSMEGAGAAKSTVGRATVVLLGATLLWRAVRLAYIALREFPHVQAFVYLEGLCAIGWVKYRSVDTDKIICFVSFFCLVPWHMILFFGRKLDRVTVIYWPYQSESCCQLSLILYVYKSPHPSLRIVRKVNIAHDIPT